jgi:hypothetical protein
MTNKRFGNYISSIFDIHEFGNASAILKYDHPNEYNDILSSLNNFSLNKSHLIVSGGGRSKIPPMIEDPLIENEWAEKNFNINISLDGEQRKIETHKIDCFKNKIGFEVEWNNKTEFYDRDLNNFRVLHSLGALNVGIIVTRSDELDDLFKDLGIYAKYGPSTTILSKLLFKVSSGALGGCPLIVFGIKKNSYKSNS